MKKVIAILLTLFLLLTAVGCGEIKKETNMNDDSIVSETDEPQKTLTFVAISGAVITKQDGSSCVYRKKCDACGYVDFTGSVKKREYISYFTCECGHRQRIEIDYYTS